MNFLPRFTEPPCIINRTTGRADWVWFLDDLGFRRQEVMRRASAIALAQGIATFQG